MSGGERLLALAAAGRPSTQLGGSSALPVGLKARRCDRERVRYADSCARSGWLRGRAWLGGRGEACTQSGGERLLALAAAGRPCTQLGGPSALPMGLRARSCDRARDR
jgi:hypothetical protein